MVAGGYVLNREESFFSAATCAGEVISRVYEQEIIKSRCMRLLSCWSGEIFPAGNGVLPK